MCSSNGMKPYWPTTSRLCPPWVLKITDDDKHQTAKQYSPPKLYVGGPVITMINKKKLEFTDGIL